jgi:prophage regulatory protein
MSTSPNHPGQSLILERLPEVKARTGLSRSEIYRRIQTRSFPAPIKLGQRASAWVTSEVEQWIQARIEARDALGRLTPPKASGPRK